MSGTTYEERVAARQASRPAIEADHKAGRHDDLEGYVDNCPACEAEEEAQNAKEEAESRARLKAERKAEREAARVRAAWLRANPDAIAWRCASCGAEFTDGAADEGQGASTSAARAARRSPAPAPPMATPTAARSAGTSDRSSPTSRVRSAKKESLSRSGPMTTRTPDLGLHRRA